MHATLLVLLLSGGGPIDLEAVPRKLEKLPELFSEQPLYGLFLFGEHGGTRVWAVLDQSQRGAPGHDVLYLDLDADGNPCAAAERFSGRLDEKSEEKTYIFEIGAYTPPGTAGGHSEFRITASVSWTHFRMLWRGDKPTFGGYGPTRDDYGRFAPTLEEAPIFVPGYDLPFQFERWYGDTLGRGERNVFKVFVGNRGLGRGTFTAVDDKFLPAGEYVIATLVYRDETGAEKDHASRLAERC
jgi:hypothetical protein